MKNAIGIVVLIGLILVVSASLVGKEQEEPTQSILYMVRDIGDRTREYVEEAIQTGQEGIEALGKVTNAQDVGEALWLLIISGTQIVATPVAIAWHIISVMSEYIAVLQF